MIRSGTLTFLCADKAGHTLTHTQTALPKHQRLITHLCVIFLWLCLQPLYFFRAVWGFNRANPTQRVFSRSNVCFILTKCLAQNQDFYQLKKAESYLLLISTAENKDTVLFKESTSLSSFTAVRCITNMSHFKVIVKRKEDHLYLRFCGICSGESVYVGGV